MRWGMAWIAAAILFAAANAFSANEAAAQELVHFPSLDGVAGHEGTTLDGYLFRVAGDARRPAVVFLHGCGGMFSRAGPIDQRLRDWAAALNGAGYSVLMVDSWRPRGVVNMCAPAGYNRAVVEARPRDAYGALYYLQSQPFVRGDRIAVIGWSAGGGIVLDTADRGDPARPATLPQGDFRAAAAFYPARCSPQQRPPEWTSGIPLLVLQGAADVWTPAAPCQAVVGAAIARGAPIEMQVYPGAYHDFDSPNLQMRQYPQYTTRAGVVPIMGTDPAARQDAFARVPAFLARYLNN